MSNTNEFDYELDASQWQCPMPLLKMRLQLQRMQKDEVLLVLASDAGSWRDIPKYIAQSTHKLLDCIEQENHYRFLIQKGE